VGVDVLVLSIGYTRRFFEKTTEMERRWCKSQALILDLVSRVEGFESDDREAELQVSWDSLVYIWRNGGGHLLGRNQLYCVYVTGLSRSSSLFGDAGGSKNTNLPMLRLSRRVS